MINFFHHYLSSNENKFLQKNAEYHLKLIKKIRSIYVGGLYVM